jgi:hypothetical protein
MERINEEEPKLFGDLDINWNEELEDQDNEEGYGYFDELESNTVSLASENNDENSNFESEATSSDEEDGYNDPTLSMRAYAMKHWYHQRTQDADHSSDSV